MLHAIAAAGRAAGADQAVPFGRLSLEFGPNRRRGDPLGELLWRVKWLRDGSPYNVMRASHLLIHRMGRGARRRLSPTMQVVAVVALLEWLGDQCTECRGGVRPGAKVAARDGVFWCPACEGLNGVRRMTTTARAIAVGTTLRSWQGTKGKGRDVAIFQEHWGRRYGVRYG